MQNYPEHLSVRRSPECSGIATVFLYGIADFCPDLGRRAAKFRYASALRAWGTQTYPVLGAFIQLHTCVYTEIHRARPGYCPGRRRRRSRRVPLGCCLITSPWQTAIARTVVVDLSEYILFIERILCTDNDVTCGLHSPQGTRPRPATTDVLGVRSGSWVRAVRKMPLP